MPARAATPLDLPRVSALLASSLRDPSGIMASALPVPLAAGAMSSWTRLLPGLVGLNGRLRVFLEEYRVPVELVRQVAKDGKLPVVLFCAGGIATPADAALMMQLGAEGNFVGSGIFKSADPARRAKAIVEATTHFRDAKLVAEVSRGLGEAMRGLSLESIPAQERLAVRGW